jgi:hypothetical protein
VAPEQPPLSEEEKAYFPPELAHALRLIEAAAKRLREEDERYGEEWDRRLRGLAHGLEELGARIARSQIAHAAKRGRLRRFFAKLS